MPKTEEPTWNTATDAPDLPSGPMENPLTGDDDGTIILDMEGYEGQYRVLDAGSYPAIITDVQTGFMEDKKMFVNIDFSIISEDENRNATVRFWGKQNGTQGWALTDALDNLGVPRIPGTKGQFAINPNRMRGVPCVIEVSRYTGKKDGKDKNSVNRVWQADDNAKTLALNF